MIDEGIAPLVAAVEKHGIAIVGSSEGNPESAELAYLALSVQDGMEFLEQTLQVLGPGHQEAILLGIRFSAEGEIAGTRVVWHPSYTPEIIAAWLAR